MGRYHQTSRTPAQQIYETRAVPREQLQQVLPPQIGFLLRICKWCSSPVMWGGKDDAKCARREHITMTYYAWKWETTELSVSEHKLH